MNKDIDTGAGEGELRAEVLRLIILCHHITEYSVHSLHCLVWPRTFITELSMLHRRVYLIEQVL